MRLIGWLLGDITGEYIDLSKQLHKAATALPTDRLTPSDRLTYAEFVTRSQVRRAITQLAAASAMSNKPRAVDSVPF